MKTGDSWQGRWMIVAAALVALIAVGLLTWGFWRPIHRLQQLQAAEAELAPLLAYEQQRNEELHQLLDHTSSPTYPEEWARVDAGMTRPGEVRVIVTLPEEPQEAPSTPPPAQSPVPSFWQVVWQRLFGGD